VTVFVLRILLPVFDCDASFSRLDSPSQSASSASRTSDVSLISSESSQLSLCEPGSSTFCGVGKESYWDSFWNSKASLSKSFSNPSTVLELMKLSSKGLTWSRVAEPPPVRYRDFLVIASSFLALAILLSNNFLIDFLLRKTPTLLEALNSRSTSRSHFLFLGKSRQFFYYSIRRYVSKTVQRPKFFRSPRNWLHEHKFFLRVENSISHSFA
jgi:hypothetical protein